MFRLYEVYLLKLTSSVDPAVENFIEKKVLKKCNQETLFYFLKNIFLPVEDIYYLSLYPLVHIHLLKRIPRTRNVEVNM